MSLQKKYFLFSLLTAMALGLFLWWSPGRAKTSPTALYFSREPGFYDTAFELEILSALDGEIFYTLDGSDPTRDAIPYTGAISITDISWQENRYASRGDVSTGLFEETIYEVMEKFPDVYQETPGYVVPDYPVDKGTVLRAAVYDGGVRLADITGTYFVGTQEKPVYTGLQVVSLVSDPDNLFGYENGIYITGRRYDEVSAMLGIHTVPWWNFWNANYLQIGPESERQAHIEIFAEDRTLLLSSDCGIKIHGRGSRAFLPKSLNIYARREYGGSETFSASPFQHEGRRPHKFVLFSGGSDNVYMLRDRMVHALCEDLNVSTMDFYPCLVFVDGEFWGASHITESYESEYVQDHYGVAVNDVVMIKEGELIEGDNGDLELYQQMVEYISAHDMKVEEYYQQAQELIDMESYLDYFASMIYLARHGDWPHANFALWRARTPRNSSPYQDGRWRWMMYDLNSAGLAGIYAQVDTLEKALGKDPMFASLCENAEFKTLFCQRLRRMAEEVFSPDNYERYFADYLEEMLPALEANSQRFFGRERTEDILNNLEDLRTFFQQRSQFLDTMIANNFGEEYVQCSTDTN